MTAPFDAFRLPGPGPADMETLQVGELTCRYPVPSPDLIEAVVRGLRTAGRDLARMPVQRIVDAVDAAAARLADPDDPLRADADRLIPAATGYSPAMASLVLDRMVADWRAGPLTSLLRAELDDPAVLDGFTADGTGRRVRAYGPRLSFHVFAGNVPGVAVTSMVRSLLVKAPVLGKLASGQPVLPVLFARALAAVDPEIAAALAVTYWPGGASDAEWRLLEAADVVVVYGGDEAVASYRQRVPEHDRLVVHGPRFSVGLIGRHAHAGDPAPLARRVARAIATFDQHGCVSPHAVWVEDHDAAATFAHALADALDHLEHELPRGSLSPAEASAIQQERGAAEMRGHATGGVRVFAGPGTAWTVIYDREPVFRPSCLNRLVHVHPIGDLDEAVDLLAPVGRRLQSVAVEGAGTRHHALADRLARIGATRITSFERLPWPPQHWHHDGRGPLRELVRWVDIEP